MQVKFLWVLVVTLSVDGFKVGFCEFDFDTPEYGLAAGGLIG